MSSPKDGSKDSLLDNEGIERLHYATGALLDAGDFVAEQTYHRGRLARALAYLHGPGTVAGLAVEYKMATKPDDDEIEVKPGLALDPLGRLIEVPRAACIRIKRWYEGYLPEQIDKYQKGSGSNVYNVLLDPASLPNSAVVADLFLRFRVCERGKTPAFATGPFDATNAVVPSRLRDAYELRMVLRDETQIPTPASSPWPDTTQTDIAKRRVDLQDAILKAWEESTDKVLDRLRKDPMLSASLLVDEEQPDGRDRNPAWVFLARVVFAVDGAALEEGADKKKRPMRSREVFVDNRMRPFSVSAAALARWVGI